MKLTLTSLALLTIFISWLFSVHPLCSLCLCGCFFEQFLTTEAQRTQRVHREEVRKPLSCKASKILDELCCFASKVRNHCWVGSVQEAVATWSVISMRYFYDS